jgi:hypothetical protein
VKDRAALGVVRDAETQGLFVVFPLLSNSTACLPSLCTTDSNRAGPW